ncbi:MAG: endonuclease domain-containing protein [Bacteroidota bacterium]
MRHRSPQTPLRRHLRTHGTAAEAVLWTRLKNRQVAGRRFRRQHSFGPYVVDFYCPAERLAIELDGAPHFTPDGHARDAARDQHLAAAGVRVLRFENRIVFAHPEAVLATIRAAFRNTQA